MIELLVLLTILGTGCYGFLMMLGAASQVTFELPALTKKGREAQKLAKAQRIREEKSTPESIEAFKKLYPNDWWNRDYLTGNKNQPWTGNKNQPGF